MKLAIIADCHANGRNLAAYSAQMEALAVECNRRGIGTILDAGDHFDRPSVGDNHASTGAVARAVLAAIDRLTERMVEYIAIPGNHDFSGVGSADALHVIESIRDVGIRHGSASEFDREHDRLSIMYLPWSYSGDDPEAELRFMMRSTDKWDILLAHCEVGGGKMNNSKACDPRPGHWQLSRAFLEEITASGQVRHVALGHFHARQDLTTGHGGYVGALFQHSHGEEGNPAGLEVWDSVTGETEWVELDAAPKYRTIRVPIGEVPFYHLMTNLTDPRWITRVICEGEVDPVSVRQLEAAGVTVQQIVEPVERVRRAEIPAGILSDHRALMDLWGRSQKPPVDDGRLARMARVRDELLADAGAR